jgi:heptosyltransferase-2
MTLPGPRACARVLLVAPNWLGDLVMSTVLLERLARVGTLPDGRVLEVILSIRRRWLPLLADDRRPAGLVVYEREGRHRGWLGIGPLARLWRSVSADTAILMPPSLRVAAASAWARIPRRIGMRGDGRSLLLTDPVRREARGSEHYTAEALRLGAVWASTHAGLAWPERADALWPSLPGCARIAPAPETGSGPPVWNFAPGATYGDAKVWPPAQAAEWLQQAVRLEGVRIVLLGDASARPFAAALQERCAVPWHRAWDDRPGAIDLVGRTQLPAVVAILKGASLFVGNDSGLMHLSAALGLPTLGLFGSTSPRWTGPRGPRTAVLRAEGFPCQPCFRRRCNQKRFCLAALSADAVLQAARRLLTPPLQERES